MLLEVGGWLKTKSGGRRWLGVKDKSRGRRWLGVKDKRI